MSWARTMIPCSLFAFAAFVLAACGSCGGGGAETAVRATKASAKGAASGEGERASSAEPAKGEPALSVAVRLLPRHPVRFGDPVHFAIEARGPNNARVSPNVLVERRTAKGHFEEATRLVARSGCDAPPREGCVEMVPGASLVPPPWTGKIGTDPQCACSECPDAPRGIYRLVVTSCGGIQRASSEPFTL